jgi:hypothetical protein
MAASFNLRLSVRRKPRELLAVTMPPPMPQSAVSSIAFEEQAVTHHRRSHTRVSYTAQIQVHIDGDPRPAFSRDLSRGGMAFRHLVRDQPRAVIELTIPPPPTAAHAAHLVLGLFDFRRSLPVCTTSGCQFL